MSAPTLISIFDDRIELINVGGLVKGISYNDMMLGISMLRNERLANIFYRLKLIEAYGTGMLRIHECYEDVDCKPKIEVSDHAFKITLPNINYKLNTSIKNKKEISISKEAVLQLFLESRSVITRKELQRALNISQTSAGNILRELVDRKMIIKEYKGKNSRYRIIHE